MNIYLILPPIAFLIIFIVAWLEYLSLKAFSAGESWPHSAGKLKSYACGEDYKNHGAKPDYSQFFPFAFFFTIMHVVALMLATAPSGLASSTLLAVIYLCVSAVGLFILFRS